VILFSGTGKLRYGQSVPLLWLDEWPGNEAQTQLVFITDGLNKAEVEKILHTVCS